jgi:GNAT superfamily N-acetyltransferase
VAQIRIAASDDEIRRCFPVMVQLRTHLAESEFVPRVRRQEEEGYRLAFVEEGGRVKALAGYRYLENLSSGRFLYVDDLVTDQVERSKNYGAQLLGWLIEQASAAGCDNLELDSGVQRFRAHQFYLRHKMIISSHHFRLGLRDS